MISLFEKNLIRAKNELRDLKTVHQRGLSTIRFYRYTLTVTVPSGLNYTTFQATVATGEPSRPLYTAMARGTSTKTVRDVEQGYTNATTLSVSVLTTQADTITVDFISSSVLTGITKL